MPASDYYIGANDEHGLKPPTPGKRTPVLPYIYRSFYEDEFNRLAKELFIESALRQGFRVYDVKPELRDVDIPTRVARVNRQFLTLLMTFAYNAFGSAVNFNATRGYAVFYSPLSRFAEKSRILSEDVYDRLQSATDRPGLGVSTLDIGVLSSVNCPSSLIEAGYMTNFEDAKLMHDFEFTVDAAEAACMGVCENLGVTYLPRDDLSLYPTLTHGDRGNFVTMLQYMLRRYGADLSPDGVFGGATDSAVRRFQEEDGLAPDGTVGRETWSRLLLLNPAARTLTPGTGGADVWYLQKKLLSKLYPIRETNGLFDSDTLAAVKQFQQENDLPPDGVVGPKTWEKLRPSGRGRPRVY